MDVKTTEISPGMCGVSPSAYIGTVEDVSVGKGPWEGRTKGDYKDTGKGIVERCLYGVLRSLRVKMKSEKNCQLNQSK